MESFVLIPEQLSLEFKKDGLSVVSNQALSRGIRFSPFEGTLRTDGKLSGVQAERAKGERYSSWGGMNAASWIRFLRQSAKLGCEVNLIEIVSSNGQILFEVRRPIDISEELVVFSPEPPLTFTKVLKEALFEETMRGILLEVPLDLSKSVFHNIQNSSEEECDDPCISPTAISSTNSSSGKCKRTRSLLPCGVCSKAFDRPSLLKRHMRTHTGEKPHECDVCRKGFSTSSSLNTHRRIHSGEKPHECPTCGKRFTASSNLYYHKLTHQKEKPHKCLICLKSFPTPGDLKSHGYVHSGTWPFRCPVCKRGFSKHTNLKNHLFLHTGSKPHVCTVCPKRFALACNLRAHLKTHQEESSDNDNPNPIGPDLLESFHS